MTDLPEPLNTVSDDWKSRGQMPFDLRRIFEECAWVILSDRQKIARLRLMTRSWGWTDAPAGYLNRKAADLAVYANETDGWWKKNGEEVLRPWIRCSDGNLYHPELCAEAAKRRNRLQATSRLEISDNDWVKLRKAVFQRDRYRCTYCGETPPRLHCDHIIPVSRGGKSTMENLATACAACNLSKSASILEDWIAR